MDEPNYCSKQNIANISLKVLPMDGLDIDQNRNILQAFMPNTIAESFRYFIQFYFSLVHDLSLSLSLSLSHRGLSLTHLRVKASLSLHDFSFLFA